MPGINLPSGLARVARTCTLRMLFSTLGLIALMVPGYSTVGYAATMTCTGWPSAIFGTDCSGTKKSTYRLLRSCRVAIMVPLAM
ncbi:hypothetical protein D3C77_660380 [compost metagenome]